MIDLPNGTTKIDAHDFNHWCNCSNFPYQKCGECNALLGNVKHMKEGETLILNEI